VNARFRPVPGSVPGYAAPVLMSSGAFVSGATIELSCDAPLRPPFEVYVQGGVSLAHAYLGAVFAARALE
jgi:cystathionine beta-lyase family protein involved in aluminum resistance